MIYPGARGRPRTAARAASSAAAAVLRKADGSAALLQVLLTAMQPAYKFALVERINEEVLAAAAEGALPLDACGAVLSDMLRVLCVKEMAFDVKAALPVDESDDAGGISASQTQVRPPPPLASPTTWSCVMYVRELCDFRYS